jgi:hypothetical protein
MCDPKSSGIRTARGGSLPCHIGVQKLEAD